MLARWVVYRLDAGIFPGPNVPRAVKNGSIWRYNRFIRNKEEIVDNF